MTKTKSKDHGILFHAEMVRALLNTTPGSWPAFPIDRSAPIKWQTRRIVNPQPDIDGPIEISRNNYLYADDHQLFKPGKTGAAFRCPHPAGTIIWVKETWGPAWMDDRELTEAMENGEGETFFYRADWPDKNVQPSLGGSGWRSSLLMPRIASRIHLLSKSVRVERAQDISDADAIAEGFTGRDGFAALWVEINGEKSWDENPFVFVYTIPRIR